MAKNPQTNQKPPVDSADTSADDTNTVEQIVETSSPSPKPIVDTTVIMYSDNPVRSDRIKQTFASLKQTNKLSLEQIRDLHRGLFVEVMNLLLTGEKRQIGQYLTNILDAIDGVKEEFTPEKLFKFAVELKPMLGKYSVNEYSRLMYILASTANPLKRRTFGQTIGWNIIADSFHQNYSEKVVSELKDFFRVE